MAKNISIDLGTAEGKKIVWKPNTERNQHLLVVGTSGSGKTETLKAMIYELKKQGIATMIVDFHNEFSDVVDYSINLRELTINPLEVPVGRRPQDVIYQVANIVKKIFSLGDQQEAVLRNAIKSCYESKRIPISEKVEEPIDAPNFMDVRDFIEQSTGLYNKGVVVSLLNRIEPLFEVDIFDDSDVIPFDEILSKTTTIELKDFPTEDVKAAIAEFFMNKMIYYLYGKGQSDLWLYCVVDEAHRLIYDNSPLNRLLRESRKYGAGVILSSQRPSDFDETILANTGGVISLQLTLDKDAKFIGNHVSVDYRDIKNLTQSGLGYVKFSSQIESRKVQVKPLSERMTSEEIKGMRKPQSQLKINKSKDEEFDMEDYLAVDVDGEGNGSRRELICRDCTFDNDPDAIFCNECGRKL